MSQKRYLVMLRNCSRIKCDAFYSNCLRNNEITCPKGQVISEQFLTEDEKKFLHDIINRGKQCAGKRKRQGNST
jgi:hypothetical protein